jgi:hypothetical protein
MNVWIIVQMGNLGKLVLKVKISKLKILSKKLIELKKN